MKVPLNWQSHPTLCDGGQQLVKSSIAVALSVKFNRLLFASGYTGTDILLSLTRTCLRDGRLHLVKVKAGGGLDRQIQPLGFTPEHVDSDNLSSLTRNTCATAGSISSKSRMAVALSVRSSRLRPASASSVAEHTPSDSLRMRLCTLPRKFSTCGDIEQVSRRLSIKQWNTRPPTDCGCGSARLPRSPPPAVEERSKAGTSVPAQNIAEGCTPSDSLRMRLCTLCSQICSSTLHLQVREVVQDMGLPPQRCAAVTDSAGVFHGQLLSRLSSWNDIPFGAGTCAGFACLPPQRGAAAGLEGGTNFLSSLAPNKMYTHLQVRKLVQYIYSFSMSVLDSGQVIHL